MRTLKFLFFVFCLVFLLPQAGNAEKVKKNVLYLNSYHHGYQWSDSIHDGIRSVLEESEYKIDLQVEYMDAKKYNYDDVTGMLLRLYKEKFDGERFDVVLVSDNDAFSFVRHYRDILFPGVPLVFCGVNDIKDSELDQGNMTGVVENFDLVLTLDVAIKLHPDKRRMVVVGDESTAGLAIKQQVEDGVRLYRDRLEVEYWTHMSLGDMLDRVELLPSDTFLFFIPYYQPLEGKFYTAEEVMEAIYAHSNVPIYTAWEFLLGHGAVGGRLLSGFKHGQSAASMVLQILGGKSAGDIPVYREPTGQYSFDYNVMKRLNINETLLPEGSSIINAPKAFYELSKELFWTIMTSFALLLVAMVFLIVAMLERRKVERKIKDQLAFQEILMDTIPQLVSWKDANGFYLGANRAFNEFFGVSEHESVITRTTMEVASDSDYGKWSTGEDLLIIRGGVPLRKVRRKLVDSKGQQAWIEVNKVAVRDQSRRIVGVLSTVDNVTTERNLEKQLLQSQKMEAIGTLAGGIAHDFNNILTSIINSTELAAGDVEPDSVTHKDLKRVLKAARRGGWVVKQILAFSRPSKEGLRPMDIGAVVIEVLGLVETSMPSNIDVHSHVKADLACVRADPTQIHQVIMNLCTNAFHVLRDTGGLIEVRVEDASLDKDAAEMLNLEPGEFVRIAVADDGPGISMDIVDKIFDPFFTTKDKTEGTGLGLAVVHGIVKGHRGGIQVVGRPGGGTIFEVFLPKGDAVGPVCSPLDGVDHPAGGNILFVEDDEDQLHTTPRLLKAMGYSVTAMGEPEKAAHMVENMPHGFDLIISDYDMPGMSGTELAKRVAEVAPMLPVILVSGREDAVAAATHLPNIRRVVIKPYDKNDLTAAIGSVLKEGIR
jgi:PAS domain S-box-containing protein